MACNDVTPCLPCNPDYSELGCSDYPGTSCVIYNGDDIPCLNIVKTENLNEILDHLKDVVCALTPGGYSTFDFGCFASYGITTEQQFVEFISSVLCEVLGTQTVGSLTSLSNLYSLIQSLTTQFNLVKTQSVISCFQTLGSLSSTANINILLTAIQTIICNHEDRIVALESGSVNTNITIINTNHDVVLAASGTNNHTLSADVKIDVDASNSITTSSAGILCSSPDLTIVDTQSINFSVSGTKNHTITGDVKISATAGNSASILSDGIYVANASTTETPLLAIDSTDFNFIQSGVNGHTLTGNVILNPSVLNLIQSTPTGLLVSSASLQDPITPIDSNTIDITVSGVGNHSIKGDVVVSPMANNALVALSNGLFVDSLASSGWSLNGNSVISTNFLGTTNNQPLTFKVNNTSSGKITSSGVSLFGYQAANNTLSSQITAFGYRALFSNTNGSANNAFGSSALAANIIGVSNAGFGDYSLTASLGDNNSGFGNGTLQKLVTGNGNTAIGSFAGTNFTVGSELNGNYNTFLGYGSSNKTAFPNISTSVAIGKNAFVSANNMMVLGGTGADKVSVVIGASEANVSAVLDITSTTQGLLLPRMTKVQRDAIATPTAGLAVYQTDNVPGLRTFNGTNWMRYTETID